jgi:hypothetical protein
MLSISEFPDSARLFVILCVIYFWHQDARKDQMKAIAPLFRKIPVKLEESLFFFIVYF